jgi:methyl-accepting chemotaxis protein
MFTWFAQALGNISVKLKLGLGFGLVLLLTLLIALSGWQGIQAVIERGDKLGAISELNTQTLALRVSRLRYQANPNAQNTTAVEQTLGEIEANQQKLLRWLVAPDDAQLLNQQNSITREYQRIFGELQKTFENRVRADENMVRKAEYAGQQLREVSDDIATSSAQIEQDSHQSLTLLYAVTKVAQRLQQARLQAFAYIASNNSTLEQKTLDAIDLTITELQQLPSPPTADQQTALKEVEQALQDYRNAFAQYAAEFNANLKLSAQMLSAGDKLDELSHMLSNSQINKRISEAQQALQFLSVSAALALGLGILAAWVITQQIVQPLQQTLSHAERISAGDLSSDLKVSRSDEIGQLQHSMQAMTQSLRELIGHIRDGVTQIASAAEELSAVTEQTSAGVNSQRIETDQVATAMHEMTTTVQDVARNAEQASEAAQAADHEARQGDQVVQNAIVQMDRLAHEVESSAEAMEQLKRESTKIGSVLDVIKTVAEQTNLLALNAAIEAARAGEAGRGFAVVADEVRGLAQRTQKSTEEIEELIAGLQTGTQQAANRMETSRNLAGTTVELTRKAGEALESITRTVSTIQSMNLQIATAAEEQSAVAEEINRSVLNVRDVSEQTATASQQTAASSIELARLGNQLQTLVSRFRV